MGDITRTKGDVKALVGCTYVASGNATAGGTAEAGMAMYLDSTNDWKAADGSAAASVSGLIAILVAPEDVVDGDEGLSLVTKGRVTGYSGMDPGALHFVSDAVGEIATTNGTATKRIGYAESATVLNVQPNAPANPT